MEYKKLKTINLRESNLYELGKQIFGTGLEEFIFKNAKKDPFLFTIENKSWEFFGFLTKNDANLKLIEDLIKQEKINPDISLISRINVNDFIGGIYQLLDRIHFLETFDSIRSSYPSELRLDIKRYPLILGKKASNAFYKERPVALYKGYLEEIFSQI